ncbi:MAG: histidine phosphatase family protein, partial [Prochlorococcaceae cyanobacterium]
MAPLRELVLLRHGIALDREVAAAEAMADGDRPLTGRGRERTRAVLERLRQLDLVADRLLTSPLRRARQTADLALAAGLAPELEQSAALAPGGDPLPLLELWAAAAVAPGERGRLLLVGHEPDLGLLAARLIGAPAGSIALRKAGV